MTKEIHINAPGAGEQVMLWAGGAKFRPGEDHVLSTHAGGRLLGGFVLTQYMGNAIAVHDGACDPHWCSRDLLWMMFHYVFRQLHCQKLIAPTASDNHHALALNMRAGFRLETIIRDVIRPGRHLMVLTMVETDCPWLDIIPQSYLPGGGAWKVQDHG